MNKNIMKLKDYTELKNFYNTASSIETLYKRLYELEIQGKKDTDEFRKNKIYLKIALEVEKDQYKNFSTNINKYKLWAKYLLEERLPEDYLDNTASIMEQEYNNRPVKRILKRILINLTKYDKNTINQTLDNIYTTFDYLDMEGIGNITPDFIDKDINVLLNIKHEIKMTFLILLEEYINNPTYEAMKNELIKVKYNYAFVDQEIERTLYIKDFTIPNNLEIKSKNIAEFNNMDHNIYNILRNCYGKKMSMDQIYNLLEVTDSAYKDKKNIISSILKLCMIRAGASVLDNNFMEDLYFDYYNEVEKTNKTNNEISKDAIFKCLDNIDKDIRKIKKITF